MADIKLHTNREAYWCLALYKALYKSIENISLNPWTLNKWDSHCETARRTLYRVNHSK